MRVALLLLAALVALSYASPVENDDMTYPELKEKIKKFIEEQFPGLQDKVKQKVLDVLNKAKTKRELIRQAGMEIFKIAAEFHKNIAQIFKDLMSKLGQTMDEPSKFEQAKNKIKKYIDEKLPSLRDSVKQSLKNAVDKAKNFGEMIRNSFKVMMQNAKDFGKDMKKKVLEFLKRFSKQDKSMDEEDQTSVQDLKDKIKKFIEEKFPGLQDKIKLKAIKAIYTAKSYREVMKEAGRQMIELAKKAKNDLVQTMKELIAKLRGNKSDMDDMSSMSLAEAKKNLVAKFEKTFPGLKDNVKKAFKDAVDKANSKIEMIRNAIVAMIKKASDFGDKMKTKIMEFFKNLRSKDDELYDEDSLDDLKEKIMKKIEEVFPGLQDKVKKSIKEAMEQAKNKVEMIKAAINKLKEQLKNSQQKAKARLVEIIAKIWKPSSLDEPSALSLKETREKVKKFIEEKFPGLQDKVKESIKKAIDAANSKKEMIKAALQKIKENVKEAQKKLKARLAELFKKLSGKQSDEASKLSLKEYKEKVKKYIDEKLPKLQNKVKESIKKAVDAANSKFEVIKNALLKVMQNLKEFKNDMKKRFLEFLKKFNKKESSDEDASLDALKAKMKKFIEDKFPGLQDKIKDSFKKAIDAANSKKEMIRNAVLEMFKNAAKMSAEMRKHITDFFQKYNQQDFQ